MTDSPLLLGLDCAAAPERVGCACATCSPQPFIVEVCSGRSWEDLATTVAGWMAGHPGPALLCLDAPLGWPLAMGDLLPRHEAGQALPVAAERLFSRLTDREVARRLGKRPMEVGANYIARAALAAVNFLQRLREVSGQTIPLAWSAGPPRATAAIEVYPAGVLASRGLLRSGYKKTLADREGMLATLSSLLTLPAAVQEACRRSEHLLDACLCCLAGVDFLLGHTPGPSKAQLPTARLEGWIWVRDPLQAP